MIYISIWYGTNQYGVNKFNRTQIFIEYKIKMKGENRCLYENLPY